MSKPGYRPLNARPERLIWCANAAHPPEWRTALIARPPAGRQPIDAASFGGDVAGFLTVFLWRLLPGKDTSIRIDALDRSSRPNWPSLGTRNAQRAGTFPPETL